MITIWYFQDAPQEYQDLSTHGGDEDYVMLVTGIMHESFLPDSIVRRGLLGASSTDKHDLPNGDIVYIGAHA